MDEEACECGHPMFLHFDEYGGRCGGPVAVDIGSGDLEEDVCGCKRFRLPSPPPISTDGTLGTRKETP